MHLNVVRVLWSTTCIILLSGRTSLSCTSLIVTTEIKPALLAFCVGIRKIMNFREANASSIELGLLLLILVRHRTAWADAFIWPISFAVGRRVLSFHFRLNFSLLLFFLRDSFQLGSAVRKRSKSALHYTINKHKLERMYNFTQAGCICINLF